MIPRLVYPSDEATGRTTGTPCPKPKKRGPKPRTRIARGKAPSPRRQRGERGKLRELSDDLMSLFIRERAEWACQRCLRSWRFMALQCAHIVAKGPYPAGRYREDNAVCLCAGCHRYMTGRDPEWRAWVDATFGAGYYDRMAQLVQIRVGPHDYRMVAIYYGAKIRPPFSSWPPRAQEKYTQVLMRAAKLGIVVGRPL